MKMFLSDMIDRLTILFLKVDHGYYALLPQLEDYVKGVAEEMSKFDTNTRNKVLELKTQLYITNSKIWNLESDIRLGKENKLGIKEVGERALKIRDINAERVRIKNEIEQITSVWDVKINHGSEK